MSIAEILDLLQRGGPWTLVVILGLVVKYLFTEMRRRDLEHIKQLQDAHDQALERAQKLNDRVISATERQIPLLQATNEHNKALLRALNAHKGGLEEEP